MLERVEAWVRCEGLEVWDDVLHARRIQFLVCLVGGLGCLVTGLEAWYLGRIGNPMWLFFATGFLFHAALTVFLCLFRAHVLICVFMTLVAIATVLYLVCAAMLGGRFALSTNLPALLFCALMLKLAGLAFRRPLAMILSCTALAGGALIIVGSSPGDAASATASGRDAMVLGSIGTLLQLLAINQFALTMRELSASRLRKANRSVEKFVRDREASERERAIQEKVSHMNRVSRIQALTTSLSHELNQPLGSALTFAQAGARWLDRPDPDLAEVRSANHGVIAELERVRAVMETFRAKAERTPTLPEPRDLVAVIERLLDLIAPGYHAQGITVSVACAVAPEERTALVREAEIGQVLLDFINNSAEAFAPGRSDKWIEVFVEVDTPGWIEIGVRDNAGGIDEAARPHVEAPFYTTKINGSGLGLAICRAIAESHGGTLVIESKPGVGCSCSIIIPRQ